MIVFTTTVPLTGVSGSQVLEFMLDCTDDEYRKWWPGTHLAFHTTDPSTGILGRQVFFDEYVGNHRMTYHARITRYVQGRLIEWQMVKWLPLPARLVLTCDDTDSGVIIGHTLSVGFGGPGAVLDPLFRWFVPKDLDGHLREHASIEFTRLAAALQHGHLRGCPSKDIIRETLCSTRSSRA